MRVYWKGGSHLLCGHWNGSPLEIGLTGRMTRVPGREARHHHPYREYYLVLEGRATLEVEGHEVPLEPETLVMVEAGERHRVVAIDPDQGVRWVVIKERSEPDSKIVDEPG